MESPEKKSQFEPLVPLGFFLIFFGLVITYAALIPKDFVDKMVNLASGLAFLIWGGGWLYVGWKRAKRMKEAAPPKKDEKL